MKVTYTANNSGGHWWLKDEDWIALEKAGWEVCWGEMYFCHSKWSPAPNGKPQPCKDADSCKGHRTCKSAKEANTHRWHGALAQSASKEFPTPTDAMREFERITGQDVSAEGCNCCGAPHEFRWDNNYASGSNCLTYLYHNPPKTLREAAEREANHAK